MTTAYYSTVLNHPLETVWGLIRDFNNYPAYIEGVSESVIEDDKGGDEVGAVRRFCYLGNWIRQRLVGHSDQAHTLTYAGIDPFPFPAGLAPDAPAPTHYEGTMHLLPVVEGNRTFIEWKVRLDTAPQDADRWQTCSSHGYRTGRIRLRERWGGQPDQSAAVTVAALRRPSVARRRKS